jgi:anti-sigma factor RsiW
VSCQIGLELTALADGTLAAERRIALLRKIAASPNLAQALAQQMLAVEAIRRLDTRAPTELRERIQRGTRDACTTPQRSPPAER